MEHADSAQSLLSRGGSEMESSFLESGLYITSLAATIFIAALFTVGLLFITLLIALAFMLQSCQSRSSGVIELLQTSDDYGYCKVFTLHAELNALEADEFPKVCKTLAIQYVKEGQYLRDLNLSMSVAESYLSSLAPENDGLDVVLIDLDDFFLSNPHNHQLHNRLGQHDMNEWAEEAKHLKHMLVLGLYKKLQTRRWSLILITRKPEEQRNAVQESLIVAGYGGWSSLIMRSDSEMQMASWEYFSRKREHLQNQSFRIRSVISSQLDALTGPCLGKRNFKLANPIYYRLKDQTREHPTAKIV
ncbi:uncharacterized protein At2g39920 [Macadamia integrifolia]|uniref:uncharacterized protein At2g39920 n=1 Tax=Macadamia integrifolia TaxID=60698 RepID=UPI001C4F7CDB|nr:uncharacterized protein At2g39920 [Macadamia integrifolia]XP_042512415.1 uncharacterized protein At2g39920 [Macadamia integrifolia]XP_042512416.1 uncharacterized protein At2g39920 [Macadamia integrifolia]